MTPHEYDGLVKLIGATHGETLRSLEKIDKQFTVYNKRVDAIEENVKKNSKQLTRISTIGTIVAPVWTAIVLFLGRWFK